MGGSALGGILGGLIAQGSDILGHKAAGADFSAAERLIGGYEKDLQDFISSEYGRTAGMRADASAFTGASKSAIPALSDMALNPTMSASARLASREGLRSLQEGFATSGSPSSGAAGIAAGRFEAGIQASELDRQQRNLMSLVSLYQPGLALSNAGNNILNLYPQLTKLQEDQVGLKWGRGLETLHFYNQLGQHGAETGQATGDMISGGMGGGGAGGGTALSGSGVAGGGMSVNSGTLSGGQWNY